MAAMIAISIASVHVALVVLISVTAVFSRREPRREAALAVLKVLTGYGHSSEPAALPSSGSKPNLIDLGWLIRGLTCGDDRDTS
jgi:hypothetical protein